MRQRRVRKFSVQFRHRSYVQGALEAGAEVRHASTKARRTVRNNDDVDDDAAGCRSSYPNDEVNDKGRRKRGGGKGDYDDRAKGQERRSFIASSFRRRL